MNEFAKTGWKLFSRDEALADWVDAVWPHAVAASEDPGMRADWLRCDGTWFVGVSALANDGRGVVAGGPVLECAALRFADAVSPGRGELDRGQVSVCYPGYPRHGPEESDAAFRYRVRRDAAHLDGLLRQGADARRFLQEYHAYILGVPLNDAGPDAAPLVVWEGSHKVLAAMLGEALADVAPQDWCEIDLTDAYQAARREIFKSCERRIVHARPGEAYVVHRFALHGVAPWTTGEVPRMIAYFRPEVRDLGVGFLDP